jgi:chromosome partitioning protein
MRTVAIVAQKGGAGKTTLAVHLAVAAMRAGENVALLDTDPQGSAIAWSNARATSSNGTSSRTKRLIGELTVVAIDPADVEDALREARRDRFTLAIIDTAPRAAPLAAAVIRAATFALIPQRPSAFDLAALDRTVAIVNAAKTPALIVLNACPARAPEVDEAREVCKGHGLAVADVAIGDRRAFARAVQTGRAVEEFSPRSPAAAEIRELWVLIDRRSKK